MPITERDNDAWGRNLRAAGSARDEALADLRKILRRGLRAALSGWTTTRGREFDELADDFVQEALLTILDKLDTFRGLSRFTTWAHKICVRLALTELRRLRWKDVSLDSLLEQGAPMPAADFSRTPEASAVRADTMAWVMGIVDEELSEKQRRALLAVALGGMPLEEVARRLNTNRNALYKLLHDARVALKRRMERDGMTMGEMMRD